MMNDAMPTSLQTKLAGKAWQTNLSSCRMPRTNRLLSHCESLPQFLMKSTCNTWVHTYKNLIICIVASWPSSVQLDSPSPCSVVNYTGSKSTDTVCPRCLMSSLSFYCLAPV